MLWLLDVFVSIRQRLLFYTDKSCVFVCVIQHFSVDLLSAVVSTVRLWWKIYKKILSPPFHCSSISFSDLLHMIWSDLVALYCQKKENTFNFLCAFCSLEPQPFWMPFICSLWVQWGIPTIQYLHGLHITCRLQLQIGLCDAKCPYSPTRLFPLQVDSGCW